MQFKQTQRETKSFFLKIFLPVKVIVNVLITFKFIEKLSNQKKNTDDKLFLNRKILKEYYTLKKYVQFSHFYVI